MAANDVRIESMSCQRGRSNSGFGSVDINFLSFYNDFMMEKKKYRFVHLPLVFVLFFTCLLGICQFAFTEEHEPGIEFELSGIWISSKGSQLEIHRESHHFRWFNKNTKKEGEIFYNEEGVMKTWKDHSGGHELAGQIVKRNPEGLPVKINWNNGTSYFRKESGLHEPSSEGSPEERRREERPFSMGAKTPEKKVTLNHLEHQENKNTQHPIHFVDQINPDNLKQPIVSGFRILRKTPYKAWLEVDYHFEKSQGGPVAIVSKIFANGKQIGSNGFITLGSIWEMPDVPYSANGKTVLPIIVNYYDINDGKGAGPGNKSDQIAFYIFDKKLKKALKVNQFKFDQTWGYDEVQLVQTKRISQQLLEAIFFYSCKSSHWYSHDWKKDGYNAVRLHASMFYQGQETGPSSSFKILHYSYPPASISERTTLKLHFDSYDANPKCDEIRVWLSVAPPGKKSYIIYKKNFKINLI